MVTLSTPNRSAFADSVEENQKKYAKRHGYEYIKYNYSLDRSRPEEWSKIKALLKVLKSTKSCWVLWIDHDVVITDLAKPLTYFTNKYGKGKNLIIAKDAYYKRGIPINNGIFLIRNRPWSRQFLRTIWQEGPKRGYMIRGASLLEQQTMTDLITENKLYSEKTAIIDQHEMNSFLRSPSLYPDDPAESIWQPGDFAAHVTGMPLELRAKIIRELIAPNGVPRIIEKEYR